MNGQLRTEEECVRFIQNLDAYIDGELSGPDAAAFVNHADMCAACGAELRAAQALSRALNILDKGTTLPLSGQIAWRSAIRARKRNPRLSRMRAAASMAAALIVLVTGTAFLRIQPFSQPVRAAYDIAHVNPAAQHAGTQVSAADPWVGTHISTDGSYDGASAMTDMSGRNRRITRAERAIETDDFDSDSLNIYDLVSEYNGYFVESSVSGTATGGSRTAHYSLRVPTKSLSDFLLALTDVGETVFAGEAAEDIQSDYVDTEARLTSIRAQIQRLNELTGEAASVSEIVSIEAKLAELQGEAERLEARLISYEDEQYESYVYITLSERGGSAGQPLNDRMSEGFSASKDWFGRFFRDMAVALAYAAPALAVIIPLGALIMAVTRASRKR